jgi:hypothetical protein
MADIFTGSPLPTITETTQKQQALPEFYTNYLQDVANIGTGAIQQGGVAGFSPLQQQAFQMAPQASFAGAQTAGDAASLLGASGTTAAPSMVGAYMNPYVSNVVNEMARLQQQNIQRNVLPALGGAGVGTGSFGSKRQATATGQTLADMQANLLGQQYGALSSGYKDAISAAQSDLNRQLQAGQGLGSVAQQQYNIGTGGLKTLYDLGTQQQALGQKQLDYPMLQAQNLAKLFQGVTLPASEVSQVTKPASTTQLGQSPLAQITGLLSGISGIINPPASGTTSTGTISPAAQAALTSQGFGLDDITKIANAVRGFGNIFMKEGGTVKTKKVPAHIHERIQQMKARKKSWH